METRLREEAVGAVSAAEGFVPAAGLDLDLEGGKDLIRVKGGVLLSVTGTPVR